MCEAYTDSIVTAKFYTRKELVVIDLSILDFRQQLYITAIHKLALNLPYVCIIGKHPFGNTHIEAFKRRAAYQYVLFFCDYAELVIANFTDQIQY